MPLRNERLGSGGALVASAVAMLEQKHNTINNNTATGPPPRRPIRPLALSKPFIDSKDFSTNLPNKNIPSAKITSQQIENKVPIVVSEKSVSASKVFTTDEMGLRKQNPSCSVVETLVKYKTTKENNAEEHYVNNESESDNSDSKNSLCSSTKVYEDVSQNSNTILHLNEKDLKNEYTSTKNNGNKPKFIKKENGDSLRPLSTSSETSTIGSDTMVVCDEEESDESSSGSSDTDSSSEGSSSGREFVIMDVNGCFGPMGGLEPITEEERPVTSSSINEEGRDDDSSPDDDSTLKASDYKIEASENNNETWSVSSSHHGTSTSDLSSSSSSGGKQKSSSKPQADDSTCCDEDFQWISSARSQHSPSRNDDLHGTFSTSSHHASDMRRENQHQNAMASQSTSINQQYHNPQQSQNMSTKPPATNRTPNSRPRSESQSPRRVDKSAPGSLDRRRVHPPNRQERDVKSRSSHTPKDYRSSTEEHREFHFPPPPPRCELMVPQCQMRHWNCCDDLNHWNSEVLSPNSTHNPSARCAENTQNSRYHDLSSESHECFHRHHERTDPKRYGSSSVLMDCPRNEQHRLGSQPDLYSNNGSEVMERRPPPYPWRCLHPPHGRYDRGGEGCCSYHTLPPMSCCHYGWVDSDYHNYNTWNYSSKPTPDQEERIKRLEIEKESLQMQVSVLSEQIEAQSDKISELEKILNEKKQLLGNAEDLLQRVRALATYIASHIDKQKEVLSRSSLETQKLELMSAMSELKLQQAALERENVELRTSHYNMNGNHVQMSNLKKPPLIPRTSPIPQHTSTPNHQPNNQIMISALSPSPSTISSISTGPSPIRVDDNHSRTPPPSYRRTVDVHYGSLPRQAFMTNNGGLPVDNNANTQPTTNTNVPTSTSMPSKKGVAFGRGFSSLLGGARGRGQSVPNLADTEKVVIDDTDAIITYSPQPSPSLQINKNKGIKKIFGKMKRSGSGNLDDLPGDGEFRRGGVRATAGARLCWNQPQEPKRPEKPFNEWDVDNICDWLQDLGLENYLTEAKRWIKDGAQLQAASPHEIEKELGIKNPLHRKKLCLAISDMTESPGDIYLSSAGRLDTAWVLRWLDDTGLPQHKDAFLQARVDGRLLHRLTLDDLAALHVTSMLHATSLRRGIQVLREHSFEPDCLVRRSVPGENPPETKDVALWTAHRVMEWLRVVDLAEYAPNLRGAGVHGALMVHEPKFTAELMATLLNIPPNKTLLRRHLSTHFKELLGRDVIQEKREAETILGYIPLTPAAKLKVAKKSQFSLKRKKSKGELDFGDLVCPLNSTSQSGEVITSNGPTSHGDASGTMKKITGEKDMAVYHLISSDDNDEIFSNRLSSPLPQRLKDSILV